MIAQEVLSVEPIYERTDYCSDPKTLWGKLKSAKWDWLGIDARDDFVLGYPKRKGAITDTLMLEVRRHGMVQGQHTVRVYDEPTEADPTRNDVLADEPSAIAEFDRVVQEIRTSPNYRLSRVQRVEKGRVVQEWFGVTGHSESWYPESP
jgi:hypothetical protein